MKMTQTDGFLTILVAIVLAAALLLPVATFAKERGGKTHVAPHGEYIHKRYVDDSNDGLTACPDERPQNCLSDLKPVCGKKRNGNDDANYTNSCHACKDTDVIGYSDGHCTDQP